MTDPTRYYNLPPTIPPVRVGSSMDIDAPSHFDEIESLPVILFPYYHAVHIKRQFKQNWLNYQIIQLPKEHRRQILLERGLLAASA